MSLEANDLLLFARVVDEGSFSRAAERLGLPKSTLSRRITELESQLGERLLLRTTRKLSVTDFGHAVLAHAHQVTAEVESTMALAQHRQVQPSGRLRVSMPNDFANDVLANLLADFIATYPAISLELDLSARRVDLISENFDVAIRMGDLPDDATLAARRLLVATVGLYAAPSYLEKRGIPHEPEALMEHDCLRILTRNGEPAVWSFIRDEESWKGSPPARAIANSPDALVRLARSGAGITMLSDYFAEDMIKRGELVQVLCDWQMPSVTAWAVFPGRRLMPARTRVFLDALQAHFSGSGCQIMENQISARKSANKALV
ncbi:LysR family transcriptional regulator [Undibacterium sp. RTI2.1]|uniref:LysR family transcriptional regulator n=1 Tax=unclassified Undibacterium TaxID=2630295 RepID=UPI002B23D2AE|nr:MULTISPECIES: LysR family transcriptional regulator [unclassified Undibacterium]MEB0031882.1 LysR family transcriptional regulator [Undibacterium sp. RTI2.1]MEB0118162.1 LysR family transcriptional regulator [Undibacterium sp. RTI2.2]